MRLYIGLDIGWKWFRRVARHRGRKIAIVGLAGKLLTGMIASLQSGKKWDPRYRPPAFESCGR